MNKNKFFGFLKITFINLLALLIILFLADFSCFSISQNQNEKILKKNNLPNKSLKYTLIKRTFYDFYEKDIPFLLRAPLNKDSSAKSIIIFGCSFGFGDNLKANQNFSYKLSELVKAPIYNRAYSGWGVQHMLYQLQQNNFYKEVTPPSTIIYVYIAHHINRMYYYEFRPVDPIEYLKYKTTKNGLTLEKEPYNTLLTSSVFTAMRNIYIDEYKTNYKNTDKNFNNFKLYLTESKKIVDKKYPNTKFVILKYLERGPRDAFDTNPRWKELEEEGFIVLDTYSLTNKDLSLNMYKLPDGHPNEKAWDTVTPALVKKLNL